MRYVCEELFDLSHSLAGGAMTGEYPWAILGDLTELILTLGECLPQEAYECRGAGVWVARSATVDPGAVIAAPTIVGEDSEIRNGAYIRGSALIGDGCVIGHASEIKNSILFDECKVPHFNYVGDSILGYRVHLGAGTVLSNVRCDREKVVVRCDPPVTTSRRKVGAFLGDGCEVGCNCVLNPGTLLGRACTVYPLTSVRGVYAGDSRISRRHT